MPWGEKDKTKELEWQRAGGKASGVVKRSLNEKIQAFLASGECTQYFENLTRLSECQELTAPEREFMDRFEALFPYAAAKKSENKTSLTDGEGKPLAAPVINVVVSNPTQNDS